MANEHFLVMHQELEIVHTPLRIQPEENMNTLMVLCMVGLPSIRSKPKISEATKAVFLSPFHIKPNVENNTCTTHSGAWNSLFAAEWASKQLLGGWNAWVPTYLSPVHQPGTN